jgi:hypothetical protein
MPGIGMQPRFELHWPDLLGSDSSATRLTRDGGWYAIRSHRVDYATGGEYGRSHYA